MYTRFEELIHILIFTLLVWAAGVVAQANVPRTCVTDAVCDQKTYDLIYSTIVKAALLSQLTPQDIKTRNDSIETLRQLCEGQMSTYERSTK